MKCDRTSNTAFVLLFGLNTSMALAGPPASKPTSPYFIPNAHPPGHCLDLNVGPDSITRAADDFKPIAGGLANSSNPNNNNPRRIGTYPAELPAMAKAPVNPCDEPFEPGLYVDNTSPDPDHPTTILPLGKTAMQMEFAKPNRNPGGAGDQMINPNNSGWGNGNGLTDHSGAATLDITPHLSWQILGGGDGSVGMKSFTVWGTGVQWRNDDRSLFVDAGVGITHGDHPYRGTQFGGVLLTYIPKPYPWLSKRKTPGPPEIGSDPITWLCRSSCSTSPRGHRQQGERRSSKTLERD